MKFLRQLLATTAIAALATQAQAGLIGDTIAASGNALGPSSATIGGAVEFNFIGHECFDFGANSLTISRCANSGVAFLSWSSFGNFVFSGFDTPITGMSIASNTGYSGELLDFSFTASSITLRWDNGSRNGRDAQLVFNIETGNAVPEPASLGLVGLGLMGAGLSAARRRKAA